ncbi:CDP-diacylglycerol--glycerol-3-phosphate 3-phosphatidyltransferase [Nocardioides sp. KR10-350]|uniref:CDP-diacylglycerol--glycerol-3-phosphate 3-phosphatidyltransferase n=1 Tax=Nocardioides cheoyonin TaxID=3156615 RepID=UPI0032B55B33
MSQPTPAAEARKVSNWNVPNVLTSLRILLVPFFGWTLLIDDGQQAHWRLVAWAIFFVAMVTDKIDGDLARKHNLVTDFGKIADPIADKAITGMAFIGLAIVHDTWWWWTITILVLAREWSVTFVRLAVASKVVIAADTLGKWKTFIQGIALGGLVLPLTDPDAADWWHTPGDVLYWAFVACLVVAVVLTFWSGVQFYWGVWTQRARLRG